MRGRWAILRAMGTLLLAAIALFVATNIDDLFILVGFFADPKFRAREIYAGQYLGIAALISVSLIAALAALVIPDQYVGLLGLLPIAIGCKQLVDLWRGEEDDDDEAGHRQTGSGIARIVAVAAITVANGGDNVGVYTPVFAVRSAAENLVICVTFIILTAAWCAFAHWLVSHPTLGSPLRRYSPRVMPWVLIALGVLILYDANSLRLLT